MTEKPFGAPAFVQPHNINLPHKGTRQTMHFREDAPRLSAVPEALRNQNWRRMMGEKNSGLPGLAADEDRLLGRLYDGDVDLEATPEMRYAAAELVRRGLATQAQLTLSATPAGIQWHKAVHDIKGIYETDTPAA